MHDRCIPRRSRGRCRSLGAESLSSGCSFVALLQYCVRFLMALMTGTIQRSSSKRCAGFRFRSTANTYLAPSFPHTGRCIFTKDLSTRFSSLTSSVRSGVFLGGHPAAASRSFLMPFVGRGDGGSFFPIVVIIIIIIPVRWALIPCKWM